eukprot:TRINITY_DN5038_c0_g1_i4.p1 TRINITY_DN5038_c0_g1~~TRINITY_DN5038_c0_g1_i4.p1  ORF type:complete len:369 (+),score=105.39 TRINITY_DN5038_c0_g1_i4:73-1179(+)
MPVLVCDLLCTELWRERALPLVVKLIETNPPPDLSLLKLFVILNHESSLVNLLELCLYNKEACVALDDIASDLAEYCCRQLLALLSEKEEDEAGSPEIQQLRRMSNTATSAVRFGCLSIVRYMTDYAKDLPLSVLYALLENNDVVQILVEVVERRSWEVRNGDSLQRWENGRWTAAPTGQPQTLTQAEAQVWLALNNLLMDQVFRAKYRFTTANKSIVLKLRRYMTEELIDQIPPLADLRMQLDQLAVFDSPLPTDVARASAVMIQQVSTVRETLATAVHSWQALVAAQAERLLHVSQEEKEAHFESISSVLVQSEAPRCAVCGKEAHKRCARCKNEWYCCRECQMRAWPGHKPVCDVLSEDLHLHSK